MDHQEKNYKFLKRRLEMDVISKTLQKKVANRI